METYFDTIYDRHYVQSSIKKLIALTLYKMTHLGHPDDPIFSYYSNVLEMLLYMATEQTALEIMEEASKSEEEFTTIIDNIVRMNNLYRSKNFFDMVLETSKKFENKTCWEYINHFLEGSHLIFPSEHEVKEHLFFNKNVTEMIDFINEEEGMFLETVFWNAEELSIKYQSHNLIKAMEKNLHKVKYSPDYLSMVDSIEKAKIILN